MFNPKVLNSAFSKLFLHIESLNRDLPVKDMDNRIESGELVVKGGMSASDSDAVGIVHRLSVREKDSERCATQS